MTEQDFDLGALEKVLAPKKGADKKTVPKKEKTKKQSSDRPLFVAVDKEGKEVKPKDIGVGEVYRLKQNG
jgi:hypothetical protein